MSPFTIDPLEPRTLLSLPPAATPPGQPVNIPDPGLLSDIRYALHKPRGVITAADMLKLKSLPINYVENLTGLEYARNLTDFGPVLYSDEGFSDLTPLTGLTKLRTIDMSGALVTDITPLKHLRNLRSLNLQGNEVSDVRPLTALPHLAHLILADNQVSAYEPLQRIKSLKSLDLSGMTLSSFHFGGLPRLLWLDVSSNRLTRIFLHNLPALYELRLNGNKLSGKDAVVGLQHLGALRTLNLGYNGIRSLSLPAGADRLTTLVLEDNKISDGGPLARLSNLRYLSLDGNLISSLSPLSTLDQLQYLGASNGEIRNIGDLGAMPGLKVLDLSYNHITDVHGLAGLQSIAVIDLSYNAIADASALASLQSLAWLDLLGNRLNTLANLDQLAPGTGVDVRYNNLDLAPDSPTRTELAQLLARGIDVDYSPQGQEGNIDVDATGLPVVPAPPASDVVGTYSGFEVTHYLNYGTGEFEPIALDIQSWNPAAKAPNGRIRLGPSIGNWYDSEDLVVTGASFERYEPYYTKYHITGNIHRGWITMFIGHVSWSTSEIYASKIE